MRCEVDLIKARRTRRIKEEEEEEEVIVSLFCSRMSKSTQRNDGPNIFSGFTRVCGGSGPGDRLDFLVFRSVASGRRSIPP